MKTRQPDQSCREPETLATLLADLTAGNPGISFDKKAKQTYNYLSPRAEYKKGLQQVAERIFSRELKKTATGH